MVVIEFWIGELEYSKGQPLPYGTLRERGSQKSKVKSQKSNILNPINLVALSQLT
ncbi:hypothetical protein [uncultured Nostoc sp.]|uniref:hypothetical protein n=1 Tax=uncultured Nostoc sp. TaxID=340711 RepID=UPI002620D961|nr:hypothetical protein [uncultured Nostoc sp.]